jgi:hypothetical protein
MKQIIKLDTVKQELKNRIDEIDSIEYLKNMKEWMIVTKNNGKNRETVDKLNDLGMYVFFRDGQLEKSLKTGVIFIHLDAAQYAFYFMNIPATQTGNYEFEVR